MELFKGYVPTKDKKCLVPFKGKSQSELKTYRQVKNLPEFAGILADNTILIDIDDFDQSEILMQIVEDMQIRCRVYKTTRGKHFLFKNSDVDKCGNAKTLACGLSADIKVGAKASYSILKYDGVERPVLYDIFEDEDYQELPKWLNPVNTKMRFLDMKPGDGRNQSLFNYILTLQSNDFSVEEARQTIRIINKYVLPEPLDDTEIETVLRDDSFKKPVFFKGNTFLFDKFATYLKNANHVIKINGQLHIYEGGIYVNDPAKIELEMVKNIPTLNRTKRAEVMSYLNVIVSKDTRVSSANLIAFKNGVYDMSSGELMEFSPDFVLTNKINHNYNPDAYFETADKTLDKMACYDENIRSLLEECLGFTMHRRNGLRKSFILIGDKSNGKSTYLDMVKTLLGDENIASLDLKEIGDKFKTAELFGKLANIGDDIGDEFIPNPAMFKKVVSGENITVERKGKDPFKFNPVAKLLFSANNIPRIKDKSGAVIDRMVIIPFNARFSPDDADYDPDIKYKLRTEECMEYLIQIALEGLRRVLKNNRFTISEKVQKELEEYEENNNPVISFFKEVGESTIENEATGTVFRKYTEFCIANGFQPMSKIELSKQVKKYFDFDIVTRKVKGTRYKVFVKKGEA